MPRGGPPNSQWHDPFINLKLGGGGGIKQLVEARCFNNLSEFHPNFQNC